MEKQTEPGSKDKKKSNEDEILELAEEVLSSSDDEIIGLDDNAVVTADEDDEVIDLTDVSEPPLTEEDEILDLTDDLLQTETDEDIATAKDGEVMELEEITDISADTEVAILELDEAIDALAESKQEAPAPDNAADISDDAPIDLHDTVEAPSDSPEPATTSPAFTIETDTIELTEADRETLEQEFGFETEEEGIPESPSTADEMPQGGLLSGALDERPDSAIEQTEMAEEPSGDAAVQQPVEPPVEISGVQEEEISTDIIENDAIDEGSEAVAAAAPDDQPEPIAESEIRFDAEELSKTEDESDDAPGMPRPEWSKPPSDTLQQTMELAEVDGEALRAEFERDAERAADSEIQEMPTEEILDVGLDNDAPPAPDQTMPGEQDASPAVEGIGIGDEPTADISPAGAAGSDGFTIESPADAAGTEMPLSAEELTAAGADTEPDSGVSESTRRPHGITFDPEEEDAEALEAARAGVDGMSVNFDHAESFKESDLHKDADPISIRVKEPGTEYSADEDALLNKVFESQPNAALPQDLNQTVERVVGKMLAEKIEVILAEAIEKAVEKEISRLKQLLLDDLNRTE